MIGPTKKPQDFGFKDGDTHLIVNDITEVMTAYASDGTKLWEIPCLARGQGSDTDWKHPRTDTPPGLYKLGTVYDDYGSLWQCLSLRPHAPRLRLGHVRYGKP